MRFSKFIVSAIALSVLVLLVYGLLHWMKVPTGHFLDWLIGVASFWWLLVVVTLPWNMYFNARETLEEAEKSQKKQIAVDEKEVAYVRRLARRSLLLALMLHLLSAVGLYGLAVFNISAVGYISSGAALLLTGLRPAVRAHEYIVARLHKIRREFRYPREDVDTLIGRVNKLEENVKKLNHQTNPELPDSLAAGIIRSIDGLRQDLIQLRVTQDNLTVKNQTEHEMIARESRQAIARITEDGQFLEHVREIIRFVKTA